MTKKIGNRGMSLALCGMMVSVLNPAAVYAEEKTDFNNAEADLSLILDEKVENMKSELTENDLQYILDNYSCATTDAAVKIKAKGISDFSNKDNKFSFKAELYNESDIKDNKIFSYSKEYSEEPKDVQNNLMNSVVDITPDNVDGYTDDQGVKYSKINGDNGTEFYEVTGYDKNLNGDIKIQKQINGIDVTRIRESAFSECSKLTSIEIPDSVTFIGNHAFECCFELKRVNIPNSITDIGNDTFNSCAKLESIEIPDSVKSIGRAAFIACVNLNNIKIPDSVNSIGQLAFNGCSSLKSIRIPSSVTTIEYCVFSGCTALDHIELSKGVSKICEGSFSDCSNLTNIEIPSSVNTIEDDAFLRCYSLESAMVKNDLSAKSLNKIPVKDYIIKYSESDHMEITDIDYKKGNIIIPSQILGKNVTEIREAVINKINNCEGYVEASTDSMKELLVSKGANINKIRVTHGETEKEGGKYTDEQGIIYIKSKDKDGNECYEVNGYNKKAKKDIVIPKQINGINVSIIGADAFKNFEHLNSIELPDSITRIELDSFIFCINLKSIKIPSNVTRIEKYVFEGCSNLKNVEIPSSVTSIGDYAFHDCTSLSNIDIPCSVKEIGYGAFEGCTSLKSLIVGEDTSIETNNTDIEEVMPVSDYIMRYTNNEDNSNSAKITNIDYKKENIIIPSSLFGKTINGIDKSAVNVINNCAGKAVVDSRNMYDLLRSNGVNEDKIIFKSETTSSPSSTSTSHSLSSKSGDESEDENESTNVSSSSGVVVNIGGIDGDKIGGKILSKDEGIKALQSFPLQYDINYGNINSVFAIDNEKFKGTIGSFDYRIRSLDGAIQKENFISIKCEKAVNTQNIKVNISSFNENIPIYVYKIDELRNLREVKTVQSKADLKNANLDINVRSGDEYLVQDNKSENVVKLGWNKLKGNWFVAKEDGTYAKGWYKDSASGEWYHLDLTSGKMDTGWIKNSDGLWYNLDKSTGAMRKGWFKDNDGKWYYLNSDGSMAVNTYADGYYVGADGAWINN